MSSRSDLIVDLRSLGLADRPGEWTRLERDVAAPADLRIEMIGVPTGSPLHLDLQLDSVVEGIFVSGTVTATAQGQDARTLEDLEVPLNVELSELFAYEVEEGDEETYPVDRDRIDLEPAIRDALVMALPFRPLKDGEDADEFRYTVGEDIVEEAPEDDPRWSELKRLLEEKES
ncbi:DUF177 domain-containing protein [Brevibacterium luteolum]|uniref:Metal-binding protein n=1 Tax=Brevibacterium luteolum TaxID=199591 RepID=A0A2N6PFM5_9MICO|nr:DUF177 domain-containing protein [Brevibacterium luteolum]MBU8579350.1 DUF177 domain-containing protein [Brevibacterium luteolum]MCT1872995.1 DUF177 domain-containing protein [Brevibacterium luteolum]MCT1890711.1 DUF177 domain-containing protein [Brevibacterium luteolum]PMB97473.1 metal-binding protein [Brevibacterium luteolum]